MPRDFRDLQRELTRSSDTVTQFLETLTGETLIADVVAQSQLGTGIFHGLDIGPGESLVHRTAVLKGVSTDLPYVVAESTFVPERLAGEVAARLLGTNDTIGRALDRSGIKVERRNLAEPGPPGDAATHAIAGASAEIVWSRAYVLVVDGAPAFAIQEWFLRWALEALARTTPGAASTR